MKLDKIGSLLYLIPQSFVFITSAKLIVVYSSPLSVFAEQYCRTVYSF